MKRHHIRIMFWLLASAMWHTACQEQHPGDVFLPDLIFFGTVRDPAGSGVRAGVEIKQSYFCNPSNIQFSGSVESAPDGSYELRQHQESLDGCFMVFARSIDAPLLQSDTIRVPGSELHRLGDPLGTGRIPLDIEVR